MKVPQIKGQWSRGCRVRPSSQSTVRARRQRFRTLATRSLDKELYMEQAPQNMYPQAQSNHVLGKVAGGLMLAAVVGVWLYRFIRNKRQSIRQSLSTENIAKDGGSEDEGAYTLALSRTRQAVHIQKAISYMARAMNARCMSELKCALEENQINRRPYLNVYSQHTELMDLYRLFLRNSVVPRDFGVLLQLRTMLGLTEIDAVQLENEVEKEQCFAI
eukprot:TRINITY_DN13583_c0_g2_i1.p2 TRINITY_DN13583_c0_g2~~TRINITY_DN13583_c0_g2_i1.p2  ORF type:complete len:243 (-),score=17.26 TRINITY_DN13583_c0_g2_i1:446-1096(-)